MLRNPDTAFAANGGTVYDSYIKRQFSRDEGLMSGEANAIAETADGMLWVGTYAGLYKYDGNNFTYFNEIDTVKNVNSLYVDSSDRLWIGTNDSGVTLLEGEEYVSSIDADAGLLSNQVNVISGDGQGHYYAGTSAGLVELSEKEGTISIVAEDSDAGSVKNIAIDSSGRVYANNNKGQFFCYQDGSRIDMPAGLDSELTCAAFDFTQDDRLIIGTNNQEVYIFDKDGEGFKNVSSFVLEDVVWINAIHVSDEGETFLCTDSGIFLFTEDGSYNKINTGSFDNSVDDMVTDFQGNLWFTSSRLGLLELSKSIYQELFSELGMEQVVNTTVKWQDLLYCGTDKGLVIIDESTMTTIENDITATLSDTRVRALTVDKAGSLWIATSTEGVYKLSTGEEGGYNIYAFSTDSLMPDMPYRGFCQLSDGRMIAAGDAGVVIIDDDTVVGAIAAADGLVNERTMTVLEFGDSYYLGSDGGGITQIKDDKVVKHIGKADGLSSDVILRLVYDCSSEGMYIVTSNALCYMNTAGDISILDNFPYSNNYDMICMEDGTCLILGSAGIYVASSQDLIANEKTDYTLINSKSGFTASPVANSWPCMDGNVLYLCCDTGVIRADLDQYVNSGISFRMFMNAVYIDGVKYNLTNQETIDIPADSKEVVFDLEVLNYSVTNPYMTLTLEGYDSDKKTYLLSDYKSTSYTNLSPGNYTFKASIVDGLNGKSLESYSIQVKVEESFKQSILYRVIRIIFWVLVVALVTFLITVLIGKSKAKAQAKELEQARLQLKLSNETILSIARIVDAKDSSTSQHSARVAEYAVTIAKRVGMSKEKCENIRQMALLHDIGKIGIPDAILHDVGQLTKEEQEIMKTHVTKGAEILKDFTVVDNIAIGALYHHERYDGKGYPEGLKGEEIPLEARIICLADAYDAMTTYRFYRDNLPKDAVIDELKKGKGTQFDPRLVEILLALIKEGTIDAKKTQEKTIK